ncbi:class I SAM-dependent methyltransferase [Okeania sp.]|uniref:class I SAM-dependent methyltransferase n=1 Tax=Okeania sp. TaxID=3100323 RepID=UPI002B4B3DD9|nr:class I SAM-dependent methyltransferase [Okeania sp.]MEB3343078.1 class I SAM-dependent methyltransferase [Okeania sp.]
MSKDIAKIQHQTLPSSVEVFAKNWQIYQKILKHNHMRHKEMYDVLDQFILNYPVKPFSFLDLGCGDLSTITPCLIYSNVNSYIGVDLSPQALEIAQKNIADIPGEKRLITGNIKDIVKELVSTKNSKFDIVFSSYTIHHLSTLDKQNLINDIWQILNPNSCFIFIDVLERKEKVAITI